MKFDTRDKKPKLYSLLALTVAVIATITVLSAIDGPKYAATCCLIVAVHSLVAVLSLLWAFREQLRYNPYSYNTIFYLGFALFALSVMITHMYLYINMKIYPEIYTGNTIVHTVLDSVKNYIRLSAPFILMFSAGLFISNIALIRHEGRRFTNTLGSILGMLLLAGALVMIALDKKYLMSGNETMPRYLLENLFSVVYLYFECLLIGTIVADAIVARHEPDKDKDFLIVLGCALKKDGTPTPLLQGRLDRAIDFYSKQKERTGKELMFITSGGQGADEVIPESSAMKRYLIEHGIPEERIIEENQSTSTYENMLYSKDKIWEIDPEGKVAFSTTNYHVFRSGLFARRVKMRAVGMGADTKWYFWPNAAVREFIGLLTKHRVKQAVILLGMIFSNIVLTLLAYY
ncbi:MAG: YdcF family protein [Lachnospiraceae bacterium]|jgi:uncharacterized SAM-binding protein YcdF (DUF218 family)|nr:YdcF family protein [Lachnospiraceae bacterium]